MKEGEKAAGKIFPFFFFRHRESILPLRVLRILRILRVLRIFCIFDSAPLRHRPGEADFSGAAPNEVTWPGGREHSQLMTEKGQMKESHAPLFRKGVCRNLKYLGTEKMGRNFFLLSGGKEKRCGKRGEKIVYMHEFRMSKERKEKTKKDFRKNVLFMLLICNSLVLYITRIGLKSG